LIPFQQFEIPSLALSINGGGEFVAESDDAGRLVSKEAFFEIAATLPDVGDIRYFDGAIGQLRIDLEPRSAAWQLRRYLQQLLQQRYLI
jgi:hypothetical protein